MANISSDTIDDAHTRRTRSWSDGLGRWAFLAPVLILNFVVIIGPAIALPHAFFARSILGMSSSRLLMGSLMPAKGISSRTMCFI